MDLNKFAKEVHENAKAHGWWDDDRSILETAALIHSEWSEALEEFRCDRPLVWYSCTRDEFDDYGICSPEQENICPYRAISAAPCLMRGKKPEGIAVELIDGCIRILDLFGRIEAKFMSVEKYIEAVPENVCDMPLPDFVACLHYKTSRVAEEILKYKGENPLNNVKGLANSFALALAWIKHRGLDAEALLLEKHEYNKTREYKHGKVC